MADRKPKGTISQAPDFALLVVGVSRPVTERLNAAVAAAGIDDMRSPYGFVIRALARAPLGLTELAEYLGVTKQAAIKVVDEMEARGFLVRECSDFPGLEVGALLTGPDQLVATQGHLRISIRGREDDDRLLAALEDLLRSDPPAA